MPALAFFSRLNYTARTRYQYIVMRCIHCNNALTTVQNSRKTHNNDRIWRRRACANCSEIFTTSELVDMSHIVVVKKAGFEEQFSRHKLSSEIFYATQQFKMTMRDRFVDSISREIEREILALKKNKVESSKIAESILRLLYKRHFPTFLAYLTTHIRITSETMLKDQIAYYSKRSDTSEER